MSQIKQLTKESILTALENIRQNPSIKKGRESVEYDLVYENERFPPILVLSEANKIVGGNDLTLADFGNSTKTAFNILEQHGFSIENKSSFLQILKNANKDDIRVYFDFLKDILSKFSISKNDKNIVFSTKQNQLSFIVGQRYCLVFNSKNEKSEIGFISDKETSKTSSKFEGSPVAYYNITNSPVDLNQYIENISISVERELKRTINSGFFNNDDTEFRNYVFDKESKSINYYVVGAAWYGNEKEPDQSERFINNGIWENGYTDKFLDVVKSVNVGDKVAIKSSYATRDGKSFLRIKSIGTVTENLGDGKSLKVNWQKNFVPFDIEGFGSYRNTIQKVLEEDVNDIFFSMNNLSFYSEIIKFLQQSKSTELGTLGYLKNFKGFSVKVSFGQGNQARIPWIAFLGESDTVQKGIYPVYLYFKNKNLLILAYGVSETYDSLRTWNLSNGKTINQYFNENNLGTPERYGNSYVFKVYDVSKSISQSDIDNDLNEILISYKINSINSLRKGFEKQSFIESILKAGLSIKPKFSTRFISALLTKPFVILTGLSGSGKTKLAQAFAMWICENESQYCLVPVGADWTNREPLLGFPNALKENDYVKPDNRVLDLIIDANKYPDKPFFLILDEMNLSHVERYFADFLSVMESKGEIALHSGNTDWNSVPPKISFPKNLFIIGTVNIDETTYMFSPKVLDRSNVIEFRVTKEEMETYLQNNTDVNLDILKAQGSDMATDFVELAKSSYKYDNTEVLNKTLITFFEELKKSGAEFGYRSASEILRFAAIVKKLDAEWSENEIIDAAIMQKLLPKVHGSRRKLEPVLKTLGALCLNEPSDIETLITKSELKAEDSSKIKYYVSFEKINRMYQNLISNGFTSYAEA